MKSSSRIFSRVIFTSFFGLALPLALAVESPLITPAIDLPEPPEPGFVVEFAEAGDEQLITARFRYEGDAPASGLRIVLAVPEGLRYVAGSATGPRVEVSYSVDGGQAFAPARDLLVAGDAADPEYEPRVARADEYSHIRWDLAGTFPPGIAGLVSFRAAPPAPAEPVASAESAAPAGETP